MRARRFRHTLVYSWEGMNANRETVRITSRLIIDRDTRALTLRGAQRILTPYSNRGMIEACPVLVAMHLEGDARAIIAPGQRPELNALAFLGTLPALEGSR